jgi:hypothetical protein
MITAALAFRAEPDTTVCELKARPAEFNHKSVTLKGILAAGFESFSLIAPECAGTDVWLVYGGKASTGIAYCCPGEGDRKDHKESLTIDGITVSQTNDKLFKKLKKAVRKEGRFTIQVRGTFFSGGASSKGASAGYGHFGLFTLLAIEQVFAVERIPGGPPTQ